MHPTKLARNLTTPVRNPPPLPDCPPHHKDGHPTYPYHRLVPLLHRIPNLLYPPRRHPCLLQRPRNSLFTPLLALPVNSRPGPLARFPERHPRPTREFHHVLGWSAGVFGAQVRAGGVCSIFCGVVERVQGEAWGGHGQGMGGEGYSSKECGEDYAGAGEGN